MYDKSSLTNIIDILEDLKRWDELALYEKQNILWQIKELIVFHHKTLGDPLTEKALYATLVLTNSLEASRVAFSPSTEPQEEPS